MPWWVSTVAVAMEPKPGQFRIVATTQPFNEWQALYEWWEPGETPFRGKVLFGEDEWDARTVCTDALVAK